MKYYIESSNNYEEKVLPVNENSTWSDYGKAVMNEIKPCVGGNTVKFTVYRQEDYGYKDIFHELTYVKKGESFFVTENSYPVPRKYRNDFKKNAKYSTKYLDYINPEKNSNKAYRMVDNGDGSFSAFYGRINDPESPYGKHLYFNPHVYPDYMFEIKYEEKILKGYRDVTEYLTPQTESEKKKNGGLGIENDSVRCLMESLIGYSKKTIEMNYSAPVSTVSKKAIKKARSEIKKMADIKCRTSAFNKHLVELLHIIPRKIQNVGDVMAKSKEDFEGIVQSESDLLDVLEHKIKFDKNDETVKGESILDRMDIEVYPATDKQKQEVMNKIDYGKRQYVKNIYRVINHKTQKKFDSYLKKNGIHTVKQFWHGSRNENWLSIVDDGLILNPDAVITGKMFGYGLYFAPSLSKSWGYTSMYNSTWANGSSNKCYLGLYATAYGKPLEVDSYNYDYGNYDENRLKQRGNYNCLHAKGGTMLRADEVIFYNESAVTINYLVEFEE